MHRIPSRGAHAPTQDTLGVSLPYLIALLRLAHPGLISTLPRSSFISNHPPDTDTSHLLQPGTERFSCSHLAPWATNRTAVAMAKEALSSGRVNYLIWRYVFPWREGVAAQVRTDLAFR